jgi:hypothetical protein
MSARPDEYTGTEPEPESLEDVDLPEVDFFGADYLNDPLSVCRAARDRAWAATTRHGPLVLTHRDVNELLRYPEEQMYEMDIATMLRPESEDDLSSPAIRDWIDALSLFMGPDSAHVRMRRLLNSLFTPSVVDLLDPYRLALPVGLPPPHWDHRRSSAGRPLEQNSRGGLERTAKSHELARLSKIDPGARQDH